MRLVFCGSPAFAVPTLRAVLAAGHQIELVLSQPDRPAGRTMTVRSPEVAAVAQELALPLAQPEKIRSNEDLQSRLTVIAPDAIVVVAYGRIVPKWMLDLPRFGNVNLHGSLLPKYRGAAPIQWALARGERETGVTTMRLNEGLDTGDVLLERSVRIDPGVTAPELFEQLAPLGAELMVETLAALEAGVLSGKPQDDRNATLAPILTRNDGRMLLTTRTAQEVYDRWRGFTPWPGAWGELRGKRFLVHRMRLLPGDESSEMDPAELRTIGGDLAVAAADRRLLLLDEVQLEGKPRLSGGSFARGFQVKTGERLG